ncbi:hypothetical protein Droror1_Dr00022508 [Drosera rotundifolia]
MGVDRGEMGGGVAVVVVMKVVGRQWWGRAGEAARLVWGKEEGRGKGDQATMAGGDGRQLAMTGGDGGDWQVGGRGRGDGKEEGKG